MQLIGKPKLPIREDAWDFIKLYESLGERAENFLPGRVFDNLSNFVRLCYEEPYDPAKQLAGIDRHILDLKEAIPGYVDLSLMLFPHEDSKAFLYRNKRMTFIDKLTQLIDTESVDGQTKAKALNVLTLHDFSIGNPPVTQDDIDFRTKVLLGDNVSELRKFRDVIGVSGDVEEAQWNYLLDVFDQMVVQSSHYTTEAEKKDFINRTESTVNFKGLNGFIRTVVGGSADTAVKLIREELFNKDVVEVIEFTGEQELFDTISQNSSKIFLVKVKHMRRNIFNDDRWFAFLSRIILIDDSPESRSTNTSLVFAFHNKIISTLNKVHTKKLGALANSQLNIRLILDKVNDENLEKFKVCCEQKIKDYEEELNTLKMEQLGKLDDPDRDIVLFKFDEFARQIIKDRFTVTKLHDYIELIQSLKDSKKLREINKNLIHEFEERTRQYFYSNNKSLHIATINEGGGRTQIKTYGEYLLQRKLKEVPREIVDKCITIMDIIPHNYQRTLKNHFHKNFGINLFLEKYKEHLIKVENSADNRGRFRNFLIDLGIVEEYDKKTPQQQEIIKQFISDLANLDKTSIADDVQMIIRDVLFNRDTVLKPYILFNREASWEYKDLFPVDRFDINPFDLEIGLTAEGRIDYDRLTRRLARMKSTFQLFDDSGNLWDTFCENLTIVINDPSNPAGFTDFNNEALIRFLKSLSTSKITLFLDEAYNDSVKLEDPEEPKWRTVSRYVMNNIHTYPNISVVSSISTTKNLGATGDRLGAIIATPQRKDVIDFARRMNPPEKGNTNSLYMLVNYLETAQLAKTIKDKVESRLPKNASKYRIKQWIETHVKDELLSYQKNKNPKKSANLQNRYTPFEGSPLHIFLLEELCSLDKLEVLRLPDDFKYKGEPFFTYYQTYLVKSLDAFRVNKSFRNETRKRLKWAKEIAQQIIGEENPYCSVLDSDGSYLFNLNLKEFFSYQDLEKFTFKLAEQRGIAAIPYRSGFVRFGLGGYVEGSEKSYEIYRKELEVGFKVFLDYWETFYKAKNAPENKDLRTEDILSRMFDTRSDLQFVASVLDDFSAVSSLGKKPQKSLRISNSVTLYHAFPSECGISINTISDSNNSVFEFYENIGQCNSLLEFIRSKAFTKIYENLLPQIYKNIPLIKSLDYQTVIAKYGKPTLLKYINSKFEYQPTAYVLDGPDEYSIMTAILIEMEKILFSDAKVKILALDASINPSIDKTRLEGCNALLRKYIKELLLQFNLPFEQEAIEPTIEELVLKTIEKFEELVDKSVAEADLQIIIDDLIGKLKTDARFASLKIAARIEGYVRKAIEKQVFAKELSASSRIVMLYLLNRRESLVNNLADKIANLDAKIRELDDSEMEFVCEDYLFRVADDELSYVIRDIYGGRERKIRQADLTAVTRGIVIFITSLFNKTKDTEYYFRYNHFLIRFVEAAFRKQNSSVNEMVQHGYTIYKDFEMQDKTLETHQSGALQWINEVMSKCGVIAAEQPVQTHTRYVTDAKKREYPFHKVDRRPLEDGYLSPPAEESENEYIKRLHTRPSSEFFNKRMQKFVRNMDTNDYRCKILRTGVVNELYIIQKAYIKYLTDNYRLLDVADVSLDEIRNFVPDIITFLGAPKKVISFPEIGYFDVPGPKPNENIKVLVTPLEKKGDYFGNVKKPRLTMINERVKEMGGVPIHGSLFAVEEEDGSIFVVQVGGDSGVGKSEMLAALMLKWMRKNLPGIRALKMIAGDMFHVFPDKEGNLYGVGTEVGDFSRVTDFDPDYIKYYNSLFESSADSNVEDLNSRSTISGLCDIAMPFKIDIILTASNFAREEAGITRYENPENFLLYRDSHGERREKATSGDNPNFQRTLLRYTADPNIVEVLDMHGNYLDDVLNWEKEEATGRYFLCSSYKLIDKIDLDALVTKIFADKIFPRDGKSYRIHEVKFDVIRNRFNALCAMDDEPEAATEIILDRAIFNSIFVALASTPAGQPFISETGEANVKKHLVNILKGAPDGKGKGKHIKLGILSTDLARKGKEITGPQRAAEDMRKMIQEVRNQNPQIDAAKNDVRNRVSTCYRHIFASHSQNLEVWRYNFFLYQIEQMRKAEFVRIDDLKTIVDLSRIKGFRPVSPDHEFCPLLVTPNINIELSGYTETYEQLMSLPNNMDFALEFYENASQLYIAKGYSEETIINNMVLQLLIMNGYLKPEDLTRGRITEKVNRETLAAAKYAAVKRYGEASSPASNSVNDAPVPGPEDKKGRKK